MKTSRKEIMPLVFLTHVQTDKFKAASLSVNLLTQLNREHAPGHALIPRVLMRGTKRLADMEAIGQALDMLYGARIRPIVRKKGEIQCVGLFASFVSDEALPEGEAILRDVVKLLGEILLDPAMEGAGFVQEYVAGERAQLLDEISGRVNNKTVYAISRLVEQMCDGEDFANFKLGTAEVAEEITDADLWEMYRTLLATSPIEIFYTGAAQLHTVEEALKSALGALPTIEPNEELGTDVRMNSRDEGARYFTEEMDVTQGKLSLGFRLGAAMEEPDYAALTLLHYLYGGSVNSKLFLNVRERLSLCYYAQSVLEPVKGLLLVASGIDMQKFDEAKTEILAQKDAIAAGDVTDEEFRWAKEALLTDLRLSKDDLFELEDFYLTRTILGEGCDVDALIKEVQQVTKVDVVAIAAGLELDAVYYLSGEEGADDAEEL